MKEDVLGNRLFALRTKAGWSQSEVGKKLGYSNKAVSKWENGSTQPPIDVLQKLADLFHVTVDELLSQPEKKHTVTKIVVTGGPCAGKTTALSWIQNEFVRKGYAVLFVSETATELISGGASPLQCESGTDFQKGLLRLQLEKEKVFAELAGSMKKNKVLIVCDRGALDSKAYMTADEFRSMVQDMGTNEVELRDQYDAVFHLVTAAKGAARYYTLENNQARTETPEQAEALDDRLIAAWTGHPHLRVIDNSTDFQNKMRRLLAEISSFLGEPEPMEIERKFLIAYPNVKELSRKENCSKVQIIQTYLKSDQPDEEIRIRQRGQDGHYIYYRTTKRKAGEGKRIEIEERLSQDAYLALLPQADSAYRPLHKDRYCLSENGLYYEIDIYPEWNHQAIMEIELRSLDQKIVFPDGIRVIREVTDLDAFSNHTLARIGGSHLENINA